MALAYAFRRILSINSRPASIRSRQALIAIVRSPFSTYQENQTVLAHPKQNPTTSVRAGGRFLQLIRNNPHNEEMQISGIWLRDHCRCSICYNTTTNQRSIDMASLKTTSTIQKASVDTTTADPRVFIVWNDGHQSVYSLDWIKENWCRPQRPLRVKPFLWSAVELENVGGVPAVPYSHTFSHENDGLKRLFQSILVHGVACITEAPATFEDTKRICETVALPEETMYGKYWRFSADNLDHADTAYTTVALGAHTDLTYYSQTAGYQVFHLLEHNSGNGGSTLLVDGFKVAEELRNRDPKAFQFLSTKPIPSHYLETEIYNFCEEPVIRVHPLTNEIIQFRFNSYDRATLNTFASNEEIEEFYRSYIALEEIIRNPDYEFRIKLEPGTILFIDNFRVLHGRSAFTGKRVVCGCYLQRDSFLSKAAVLCQ